MSNFYVCGPTSMKLIPYLVSKVREMKWQKGGQGPITFGVMSFIGFQILPFLKIFITDFSGTMKARKLKVCINMEMTGCIVYTRIGANGP